MNKLNTDEEEKETNDGAQLHVQEDLVVGALEAAFKEMVGKLVSNIVCF